MTAGARLRTAVAGLLVLAATACCAGVAWAADPSASPGAGGDVRTSPSAPGMMGDPLFALLGVALVGILAVAATLFAVRLADRR